MLLHYLFNVGLNNELVSHRIGLTKSLVGYTKP